jgi:hypothetical protein
MPLKWQFPAPKCCKEQGKRTGQEIKKKQTGNSDPYVFLSFPVSFNQISLQSHHVATRCDLEYHHPSAQEELCMSRMWLELPWAVGFSTSDTMPLLSPDPGT